MSSSLTAGCSGSAAAASLSSSAKLVMVYRLSSVASIQVVRLHPLLGDDRRAQRQLAAQHGGGHDLRQLADLALAVTAEQLQAFALGGQRGAAAVGGDDQ